MKAKISYQRGYRIVYKPEHPKANSVGYVLEHRLVMEQILGRYLNRYEFVHHINGDRSNNNSANLKLMTLAEHNTLHKTGKPAWNKGNSNNLTSPLKGKRGGVFVNCNICGKSIYRFSSEITERRHYYCSRYCYHLSQKG